MKRIVCRSFRIYSSSAEKIVIPNRIKRGPTDLLKALAKTVTHEDTTGGAFKYHDDPYLIPGSVASGRTFALAKEAGRKAARQLAADWPTLLYYDEDFPRMNAFRPQKKALEETGDTEEILLDRMRRHWPENAVAVYRNIRSTGGEISRETQLDLLELMSWTNCEEDSTSEESEWDEERWFRNFFQQQSGNDGFRRYRESGVHIGSASQFWFGGFFRNSWKKGGDADILFEELEPKDSRCYSARICGLARHLEGEAAFHLLTEVREKGTKVSLEAYNAVIPSCQHLASDAEGRWKKAMELLNWMKEDGLSPNLGTFNAALSLLARGRMWRGSETEAVKVFQEMIKLGIEPSAGSYKHLISVFDRAPRGLVRGIIKSCLDRLENLTEDLTVRDASDEQFFPQMILTIANKLEDLELANRLHGLTKKGSNSVLITNSAAGQLYHSCYVRLMADKLPTKEFMDIYRRIVPFHFCPDNDTGIKIMENIERNSAWDVIPEFYSDFVSLGLIWREKTTEEFLRVMKDSSGLSKEQEIRMAAVAWDMNEKYDSQYGIPDFEPYINWKPNWVVQVALILAKAGDLSRGSEVFRKLLSQKPKGEGVQVAAGSPQESLLSEYFEFCLKSGSFGDVYDVLLVAEKYNLTCLRELAFRYRNTGRALTDHERKLINEFIETSPKIFGSYVEQSEGLGEGF